MNFKEGTRRVALLIGGLGGIAGAYCSYLELKSALQQKTLHETFERLSSSDDVTKERQCRLRGNSPGCSLDPNIDIESIAEPRSQEEKLSLRKDWQRLSGADRAKYFNSLSPKDQTQFASDMGWPAKGTNKSGNASIDYDALAAKYSGVDDPFADIAIPSASELGKNGIKTINWGEGKEFKVDSIVTEDGDTLRAVAQPSRWLNLWAVLMPVVGFIVPWGSIRIISWVGEGFFVKQEP